jgi:hypothetical protein
MSEPLIASLTLDELRELMQQAGYRVEAATDPVAAVSYLRSATSGLAFDIRPGSRLAGEGEARFADIALVCVLQIAGELPADLVNGWNVARRFARLQRGGAFVALCMDVSAVGGVTRGHLGAQIEIWDRLVQDLVVYLREGLRQQQADANEASRSAAPASSI